MLIHQVGSSSRNDTLVRPLHPSALLSVAREVLLDDAATVNALHRGRVILLQLVAVVHVGLRRVDGSSLGVLQRKHVVVLIDGNELPLSGTPAGFCQVRVVVVQLASASLLQA